MGQNKESLNTTPFEKELLFISHANPQDNDAAIWLSSKLSLAGYMVWSDITQLFGGEIFWDDIEDSLRNHSAKFIVLISKNTQNAPGVLDEINLAVNLERSLKLKRFVIPIRLDNIPFEDFKINIGRKNVIDFSKNWANGLQQLFILLGKDNAPKISGLNSDISTWFHEQYSISSKTTNNPQLLSSNWLLFYNLPQNIYYSRIPVSPIKAAEMVKDFRYPAFSYEQFVGSFSTKSELQPSMPKYLVLTEGITAKTKDLINGSVPKFPNLKRREGLNMISGLLRKSWDSEMASRKLIPYKLSDYTNAWFFPKGFNINNNDSVKYIDVDGKIRSKKLVGRSNIFNVYWHFAMSAQPSLGRLNRFSFKTHVVFSEDGKTPLDSKDRMHRLRRSFCKRWWNERWRGLMLAYITQLTDSGEEIIINLSPSQHISLSISPLGFESPITLEEPNIPIKDMPDDVIDETLDEVYDLSEFEESEEEFGEETSL